MNNLSKEEMGLGVGVVVVVVVFFGLPVKGVCI